MSDTNLPRRDFLIGAAGVTLSMLAAEEIRAADTPAPPADAASGAASPAAASSAATAPSGPPVGCGVIGLGPQGRDILANLTRQPLTQAVAVCDTYEPYLNRAKEAAPKATSVTDYRKLLDAPEVQAVFVATPSHQHKQIVLDALQAGKHVYCEAPLAVTADDAKAIAQAGQGSKQVFASGLQYRSNPQHQHSLRFMRADTLSTVAEGYAQWHKKQSWRRPAPTPDRAKEINWRLDKATSAGLMGEIGIHQADIGRWFLDTMPVSVTGYGAIVFWKDGRDVADTVHCVFEYPKNILFNYDATLVNSFGGAYELFMGSDSAMMVQDLRGWMFKETDSPLLGWEVYAKKEKINEDTGIVLVANATKLLAAGQEPSKFADADAGKTPLYYAIEDFATSIQNGKKPNSGALEGYQATVLAIKANDAVVSGSKITLQKEWFDLT